MLLGTILSSFQLGCCREDATKCHIFFKSQTAAVCKYWDFSGWLHATAAVSPSLLCQFYFLWCRTKVLLAAEMLKKKSSSTRKMKYLEVD